MLHFSRTIRRRLLDSGSSIPTRWSIGGKNIFSFNLVSWVQIIPHKALSSAFRSPPQRCRHFSFN